MPHGGELEFDQEGVKLWKAINFDQDLSFEHGDSRWNALDEKKVMVPSRRGFDMVTEK